MVCSGVNSGVWPLPLCSQHTAGLSRRLAQIQCWRCVSPSAEHVSGTLILEPSIEMDLAQNLYSERIENTLLCEYIIVNGNE